MSKIKTKNEVTEEEIRLVFKTLKKRTKGLKIEGICIYGSRISGYAKPHSDYDLIVVINNYQPRIRYQYIFDQIEISAIFVAIEVSAQPSSIIGTKRGQEIS